MIQHDFHVAAGSNGFFYQLLTEEQRVRHYRFVPCLAGWVITADRLAAKRDVVVDGCTIVLRQLRQPLADFGLLTGWQLRNIN